MLEPRIFIYKDSLKIKLYKYYLGISLTSSILVFAFIWNLYLMYRNAYILLLILVGLIIIFFSNPFIGVVNVNKGGGSFNISIMLQIKRINIPKNKFLLKA